MVILLNEMPSAGSISTEEVIHSKVTVFDDFSIKAITIDIGS